MTDPVLKTFVHGLLSVALSAFVFSGLGALVAFVLYQFGV
jgi:hypothetical protein